MQLTRFHTPHIVRTAFTNIIHPNKLFMYLAKMGSFWSSIQQAKKMVPQILLYAKNNMRGTDGRLHVDPRHLNYSGRWI